MAFCWHVLDTDPPGTKPYVTWGSPEECPICHPDLYEPYPGPVEVDLSSGEPFEPVTFRHLRDIIHFKGGWHRKKVLMDPTRQLQTPIAEVRAPYHVDEYGEAWVVIDGIETKCPSIAAARKLCAAQDATRVQIRADLDALGIRDRTEKVEITLEDGTKDIVELLAPGDAGANVLQIGSFPDAPGLFQNAAAASTLADRIESEARAAARRAQRVARTPLQKLRDAVMSLLKGNR